MVGYWDVDWDRSVDDRNNISYGCFLIGNNFISWFIKKKNCVSLSTTETKYMDAKRSCTHLFWMNHMLKEYNLEQEVMALFCANLSDIKSKDSYAIDEVQTDITPHEDKEINVIGLEIEKSFTDILQKYMLSIEEDGSPCDAETFDPIDHFETMRLKPIILFEYLHFAKLIRESNVSNNKDNDGVTEDANKCNVSPYHEDIVIKMEVFVSNGNSPCKDGVKINLDN